MVSLETQKSVTVLYITIREGLILSNIDFSCIYALILPSEMQIELNYNSNILRTY